MLSHQPALAPGVLWVGLLEVGMDLSAGGKHIEHLAAQVVRLYERVDDGGGCVPPHRKANPHRVVVG